ncbi:MAG: T9SS type A sorting domain-containing protein [Candidatus Zixiibacteriota bacterium]
MVLGLNFFEGENTVRDFAEQFGITFPLLLDGLEYQDYSQPDAQSPFPLDYIIDRDGRVAYYNTEYDPNRMRAIIDSLVNPTDVEDDGSSQPIPSHFELSGNYPNPFNAATTIDYQLPISSEVRLEIFNVLGQKVATLVVGRQEPGYRSVSWDASAVSSGLYFYRLTAGEYTETKRMVLLK